MTGRWKPPPDVPLKGIRRDDVKTARCVAVSAAGCRCVLLAGHAPEHLYDPVAENLMSCPHGEHALKHLGGGAFGTSCTACDPNGDRVAMLRNSAGNSSFASENVGRFAGSEADAIVARSAVQATPLRSLALGIAYGVWLEHGCSAPFFEWLEEDRRHGEIAWYYAHAERLSQLQKERANGEGGG